MKKTELEALGLSTEQIKGVHKLHGRDLEVFKTKYGINADTETAKQAIISTLALVKSAEHLQSIFELVTSAASEELKENIHSV